MWWLNYIYTVLYAKYRVVLGTDAYLLYMFVASLGPLLVLCGFKCGQRLR